MKKAFTNPHEALRHHVTGAIERGEKQAIVVVPVPTRNDSRWWPDLYLRQGRHLMHVTPGQAAKLMAVIRGDRGASEVRPIPLHDIDGRKIGHVSYNGRVWLHDVDGDKEVPIAGEKTAAQHEAEGWKDYRCAS